LTKHGKAGSGGGVDFQIEGPEVTRAIVLHVDRRDRNAPVTSDRAVEARLEEAVGLALAIDLEIMEAIIAPVTAPKPSTLIGSGKVAEIAERVKETEAELVVVNAQLSPIQQRNLEKEWGAKVLDRTGLILEIFGRRASTREGTLQVELAHLQYQKSRLVRSWTHLERQRGGFGFLGGPGESQLEADRRLIQERISRIERQLESVVKTRALAPQGQGARALSGGRARRLHQRRQVDAVQPLERRRRAGQGPAVRNARPHHAGDPLPHGRKIILSDTVGFISDLPTSLIAAFRATLEEVLSADVILHVRDVAHADTDAQSRGREPRAGRTGHRRTAPRPASSRSGTSWTCLPPEERAQREAQATRKQGCVLVSAVTGEGLSPASRTHRRPPRRRGH
jgi:GTPase